MSLSDQVRAARDEGRLAAQNRQPAKYLYRATGNPPLLTERALAVAWRAGYQSVTAEFPVDFSS